MWASHNTAEASNLCAGTHRILTFPLSHKYDYPGSSNSQISANCLSQPLPGWSVTIYNTMSLAQITSPYGAHTPDLTGQAQSAHSLTKLKLVHKQAYPQAMPRRVPLCPGLPIRIPYGIGPGRLSGQNCPRVYIYRAPTPPFNKAINETSIERAKCFTCHLLRKECKIFSGQFYDNKMIQMCGTWQKYASSI